MALTDDVQRLYIAYFNRPADPSGLAYWVDQATRNGGSTAAIANAFSASAEYKAKFAGLPTATVINTIYQDLFGRAAEPAGRDYWGSRLDNGTFNIGTIVLAIMGGAQNSDITAVSSKAAAAAQFTTVLTGSAQVGLYTTSTAVSLALAWLNTVVDPATLAVALTNLNAVIASLAGGGSSPSGSTFTLTGGNDTVTGTPLNDTINASGTFGGTDVIDGGAGIDTLNVTDTGNIATAGTTVTNVEVANLTAGGSVTANTTGWTGLTTLSASVVGAATITTGAATTISVTETGAGQLGTSIGIDGGTAVTVATNHNTGGTVTIGGTTAATGAVTVTSNVDAGQTGGMITVNGGTTVSVTQTAVNAVGTNVTSESAVTVNGGAATTSVTVVQAGVVAGASAVAGITGVGGVGAVAAAPGTQSVSAVAGVVAVDAVVAVAGVTNNGAVQITDSKYNTATANSVTTVALSSYGNGSFIRGNALTTLSLAGTGGSLALTNATNGAGGAPTATHALALTVNKLSGTSAANTGASITVTNNDINVLNVTTTGADSWIAAFIDTALTTLNVSGTNVLKLGTLNASLTSIAVSGGAGFNDGGTTAANGFAALGGAATFTTTSSGAVNLSLNSTTQSFTGSSGVDTIRISSTVDATQTIAGGSSASDELILEGGAYALTAATGAKISGFEILGVAGNVTGTINVAQLNNPGKLHIIGNSNVAFSNVANNGTVTLDVASSIVTVGLADTTGASDTFNVVLGSATSDTVNFGTLVLKDASAVGIAAVNLVSNGVDITPGDSTPNNNTLVLTDNGLSTLNFSGTQGLSITTLNEASTQATSITLNNTNTSSFGLNIGTLTDTVLNSLSFTGTGLSRVTTLTAASATTLTIGNTGAQMATVGTFTSTANLTSLTLNGNVQIGNGLVGGTGLTDTSTAAMTVSGATDHAHVKLTLGLAGAGLAHNITLGNGNNAITDSTTAGIVNLTLGTGSNFLTIGGATTNTTGSFNITLGSHTAGTGSDYITVGTGGTNYTTAANYVITGTAVGDRIIFSTDSAATLVGHTGGVITQTAAGADVAGTIFNLRAAVDALAAHGVAYSVFGGNTYVAESISSTLAGSDTTIVQITGVHTMAASTTSGYVTIAS